MPVSYSEILRSCYHPLEPIPTGQAPLLVKLVEVRAVLFDLYGTLFISRSGEVGTSRETACEEAFAGALEALGTQADGPIGQGLRHFFDSIERSHAESRTRGIAFPEVDIVEIWREVLGELTRRGILQARPWQRADLQRLAVEYEARANPLWPMPGLRECLRSVRDRGMLMGLVSNAQFYTPEVFPALLGGRAESLGFDPKLQYYSYQHGRAKPGPDLYRIAAEDLRSRGVEPSAVLYVGNDMLNDVLPAHKIGFRTALFAGDRRSLRLREGDPQVDGLSPDVVLTSLSQLSRGVLE